MISLVVLMTSVQQWSIGLLLPVAITVGGNWGLAQFKDGSNERRLDGIESQLRSADLSQMKTNIALNTQRNEVQDAEIEGIKTLTKEQIQISNRIFDELRKLNTTTSNQELKINGLSADFDEFKDDFKQELRDLKKSVNK